MFIQPTLVLGQNGSGQNGIRTKWYWTKRYGQNGTDKMVLDKTVRTKGYGQNGIGQNGTDKMVCGQNGIGRNGTDKMVWKKWYREKMVLDKTVRTKWYGQNGTDKTLTIKSSINTLIQWCTTSGPRAPNGPGQVLKW